jgi:molybdate transport system substrate-binding protein
MSADRPHPAGEWAVGLRVWLEHAGKAVLGKGRLELLEGIDRWHSISAAARQMGMSYRRAWLLVQSINAAAGEPLVLAGPGGVHGGGARLTPAGRQAVELFRVVQDEVRSSAASVFRRLSPLPQSPPVHVMAAVSLQEVLGEIVADYALLRPADHVRVVFGASDELADHLLAGAPADLVLSADPVQLDRLEAAGLADAASRRLLAENSLAAVTPAERPVAVRRPADLLLPAVGQVAWAEPSSPLGTYTRAYLDGLGLYEPLRSRSLTFENSRGVVLAVRTGRADAGLVYGSDAARTEGCRTLFRVRRLPVAIRYEGAVIHRGRQAEAAARFLAYLTSRPAASRFRQAGFLPPRLPKR